MNVPPDAALPNSTYSAADDAATLDAFDACRHIVKMKADAGKTAHARKKYLKGFLRRIRNYDLVKTRVVVSIGYKREPVAVGNCQYWRIRKNRKKDWINKKKKKPTTTWEASKFYGDMQPIWTAFAHLLDRKMGPIPRQVTDHDVREHFGHFWMLLCQYVGISVNPPDWVNHPEVDVQEEEEEEEEE